MSFKSDGNSMLIGQSKILADPIVLSKNPFKKSFSSSLP
jgi:hypothetical protein